MTIAPLDHLWVRGSVSELDADQVEIGQKLKIIFPFSNRAIDAEVSATSTRRSIPTLGPRNSAPTIRQSRGAVQSGHVRPHVAVHSPKPGNTLIPRVAMVSVDRYEYVFVKKPGKANRFERRQIVVVKESNDVVIVAKPSLGNLGLTPGEEVVTTGSLILEQMYEDRVMTEGGLLAEGRGPGSVNSLSEPTPVVVKTPADHR